MRKHHKVGLLVLVNIFTALWARCAFGDISDYLCEIGKTYYLQGRYDDALHEFKKAVMANPENALARSYADKLSKNLPLTAESPMPKPVARAKPGWDDALNKLEASMQKPSTAVVNDKTKIVSAALDNFSQKKEPAQAKTPGLKVKGEVQARLGFTPEDIYWKRANWDLNEKNFRMISNTALDQRVNTFDPRIYDRLQVTLDTDTKEGLGFYSNITVDPWSFTGKSSKITVNSDFGDTADVELKYWSNTGYTINEAINSNRFGNSFALPEIKVENERTKAFDVKGAFSPNDTFHIPQMKIYREFQPFRELKFDYKQEGLTLKFFPIAYENESKTFDDPLKVSNNRIWWEDSPWIHGWKHGNFNSGAGANDFNKGYWDNTVSFFARDSEGRRLSSLRGFSFAFDPQEETSLSGSIASPKDPWQDYLEADNFLSATRLKQSFSDNLNAGVSVTTRTGYNNDNGKNKVDAQNYVVGTDLGYEITQGLKTSFEVAHASSEYDLTSSQYKTKAKGYAYYASVMGRFPAKSIIDEPDYNTIQPEKDEGTFNKFRLFASRMDDSFDAPLSSYVETRDDEFWSRHLHFRKPFKYYYQGEGQTLSWDDVKPYRIGNGIDIGRNTLGMRIESLFWDKKGENLVDVRNVHAADGKFIENVSREELTLTINDKLTSKVLGIYHRLPKTKGGFDPFVFDTRSRRYFTNTQIEDGKDPSITTGSFGLEYAFFNWLALNGIWEHTNDVSFGYDNFPRGILNSGNRSFISFEEGNKYRDVLNFLYSQQFFPKPPYPYYNIFKAGLRIVPIEKLELYLDYTRNPFEKAGQVDDNMNHIGFEASYSPTPKWGFSLRYTYSRWQDLDSLTQGITKVFGHHNIFSEVTYRKSIDEDFTFQYGEASRDPYLGGVLDIGWDPYGGALRTIDTQHIFRLYYRRKF